MKYYEKIKEYYNNLANRYNVDYKAGDHGTEEVQVYKYSVLSELGDIDYSTILEVGSGVGQFYKFLEERLSSFRYTGIDLSDRAYRIASETNPTIDFREQNIMDDEFSEEFDFVFADGLFYLNYGIDMKTYSDDLIHKMFVLAQKAVAINFFSKHAKDKDEKNYVYFDPGQTLEYCLKLSPKAVLRHDYLQSQFTIYLYK